MSPSQEKSTGTQYAFTVCLLIAALVMSPALLLLSRPFGDLAISVSLASSGICLALAWVNWSKYSALTILSIAPVYPATRP